MELTNENNLIENEICTISYSGTLFQKNSEQVTIVYGFGDNWDNTSEKLMTKTENGFTVEIEMLNYDKFNFCFRNSNYEWDNNNYANYTLPIEPKQTEDFSFDQNPFIEDIEEDKNALLNDILQESKLELNYIQEFDIDKLIDELLSPLLIEEFENFEETEVNENITTMLNQEISESTNTQYFESENTSLEEDSLINDLRNSVEHLSSGIDSSKNEDNIFDDLRSTINHINSHADASLEETTANLKQDIISEDLFSINVAEELDNSEKALTVINEDKFVVCSRRLSKFYIMRKKVKLALCKIIFAIPRMINKEFNTDK